MLVLYDTKTDTDLILAEKQKLEDDGVRFELQKTVTDKDFYSRIIDIRSKF